VHAVLEPDLGSNLSGTFVKTYLNQEQEVGVLALGSGTLTVLDVLLGDINTLV
jgi:hypothetical protein